MAHNYGEPKWHLLSPSLSWKGNIWGLDIALSTKCALENKLLLNQNCWSWYHFSQKLPHTLIVSDTSYCIHTLWEVSCSIFSGPPCIWTKTRGQREGWVFQAHPRMNSVIHLFPECLSWFSDFFSLQAIYHYPTQHFASHGPTPNKIYTFYFILPLHYPSFL